MALQFEYTLTRYSREQARRQLSRTDFVYAEDFGHAVRLIEFGMRAAAAVDPSWDYAIEGIRAIGYSGERNDETATVWPVDRAEES